MLGIYRISISPEADAAAFVATMKSEVFPTIGVGQQTRGGIVTGQSLVRRDTPDTATEYLWVVEWTDSGGSPFGADRAPADPAGRLEAFGASTSFERYVVESDGTLT